MTQANFPARVRSFASVGLVALLGLGPLGCPAEIVDPDETGTGTGGGACGLLPGDLVISEIVANVDGADSGREWLEIYNASGESIDLEGLTLVYEKTDGTGHKEHVIARPVEVPAGGYVVVGSILDELADTADHVDYGYGGDLGDFGNSGGYLAVSCESDPIDETYYEAVSDDASRILDGAQAPDALSNDNLDNWCDSKTEFTPGFAATPGASNDICGSGSVCGDGVEIIRPVPGDLVITEVHPDPDAVGEGEGEWYEIYSLAGDIVHLNGLEFGKDIVDEDPELVAAAACIVLSPGEYAVIAQSNDPLINGGLPIPPVWGGMTSSLTNDNSSLYIASQGELLDAVTWANSAAGKSRQLPFELFDPATNDAPEEWCDGKDSYNPPNGDWGTPGSANSCPPGAGQCYEDGVLRDIMPVEAGDLEITEFLANPSCVPDGDGEFFELYVLSDGDLNGLNIGKAGEWSDTVDFGDGVNFGPDECITVDAGDRVVFAHEQDPEINGGIEQVDVLFDMALNNSNSDLILGFGQDPGTPDEETSWTSTTDGAALSKDSNGDWCDAVDPYGCGNLGTPGEENPVCGGVQPDGCIDPDDNMVRELVAPMPGGLTITELMPNPMGAPDATGEWLEARANGSFDLNGVELGKNGALSHTINDMMCLEVNEGDYLVFAKSGAPEDNCDLPNITYVYDGLSLNNNDGNLELGYEGVLLDSYSWINSNDGASWSRDEMAMAWCAGTIPFGCGDRGSPGEANPACGMGMGGDMCLDGMMMRDIVTPNVGDLIINEFMANPTEVGDANGEWFELRAIAGFDLNNLELGQAFVDGATHTVSSNECIAVGPGGLLLLARDGDSLTNGGMDNVDYVYGGLGLTNSNGALHVAAEGVLLDEIAWTTSSAGSSTSLQPDVDDPALNDNANNADPNWCYATELYNTEDEGTPGLDNPVCN